MRIVLTLFMLMAATASAQELSWILTTADFQQSSVKLEAVDDDGITVRAGAAAEPRRILLNDLLQLDRGAAPAAAPGQLMLFLRNGDKLKGAPLALSDERLRWKHPALGELAIPLARIDALWRGPQPPSATRKEDQAVLLNGDSVAGILATVDSAGIGISRGDQTTRVEFDALAGLLFALVGDEPPRTERAFRLRLLDGSLVTAGALKLDGERLRAQIEGEVREIEMAQVLLLEQLNGPVIWLSARSPTENTHTPFLEMSWPAQFDRSVSGGPLRLPGRRAVAHGIGVHSRSRLSWELPAGFAAFRTQYAIDGNRPHADVAVRIWLDDTLAHEASSVTAGTLSPVVLLPLGGARKLTLEVDFGRNADIQDHLNWIEPALLRNPPK